jgi:hypothetical protein
MKTNRPPGRSSRAASGSHRCGSHHAAAPCSLTTRSYRPLAKGTRSPSPWIRGKTGPSWVCILRAVINCSCERSTATVLAPARASHAEKYPVPHASSTTSRPWTGPKTPRSRSGTANSPQAVSGRDHMSSAAESVNRSFITAHSARFSAMSESPTSVIQSC